METTVTTPPVKGLVISLVIIIFSMALYFTGQTANQTLSYLQYVILIGGIIWSCTSYAKQLNGNVTFGNIFAHGFKTTAVVIVLVTIYTILAIKVLFPDMLTIIIQQAKENMRKQPNVTDEQIDKGVDFMKNNFMTFAIAGIILLFGIVGLISSLIGAAVAKKNPQDPFSQVNKIGEPQ
jgi:NADH:ubiquinone oxidoreductase subunit 6 (subunit J)